MACKSSLTFIISLVFLFLAPLLAAPAVAQQSCFTAEARKIAEQRARVFREPDPDYNPVLGFNPAKGPRQGAPEVDSNGLAKPINCVANKDLSPGAGTTPKFYCSVPGVVDHNGE